MIMIMHEQVHNGGFDQYFVNAYGRFAIETIPALKEIGATKRAHLLANALKIVNEESYSPELFREKIVAKNLPGLFDSDAVIDELDSIGDEYWDLEEEDIFKLLGNFLFDNSIEEH